MNLENLDLKKLAVDSGVQFQQIAERMGVTRWYLSHVLSKPVTAVMRERIIAAIQSFQVPSEGGKA